jgi:hypothetical protein
MENLQLFISFSQYKGNHFVISWRFYSSEIKDTLYTILKKNLCTSPLQEILVLEKQV